MAEVRKCAVKIRFRRSQGAMYETGIGVGDDIAQLDAIIDANGKIVGTADLRSFAPMQYEGLMWFDISDGAKASLQLRKGRS